MTSLFKLCSDEDLEAIFYHLDYPKKCILRRCSRRWNRLLRSATVLHTVVFLLPSREFLLFTETFVNTLHMDLPHLVHLALIAVDGLRLSARQGLEEFDNYDLLDILSTLPTSRHQQRRLYFCNFGEYFYNYQKNLYASAAFDWIELRNVRLLGCEVRAILLDTLEEDQNFPEQDDCFPLRPCHPDGFMGLAVQLTGRPVIKRPLTEEIGAGWDGDNKVMDGGKKSLAVVLLGLIRDHMRHMSQHETSEMLKRLRSYDENLVQAAFIWVLKVYAPNLVRSSEQSVWTFDYNLCSPLVGRVMACYCPEDNLTNDEIDDSSWTDGSGDDAWHDDDDPLSMLLEGDPEIM